MNSFTKTASAVALAVGLAAPFAAAEASGVYYPNGAHYSRHDRGHHGHYGHHGGRDGDYVAGVITGAVVRDLLGGPSYAPRYYVPPRPVYVAPPVVYREPAYVMTPPPVYVPPQPRSRPLICDEYNNCAYADRVVTINGERCEANQYAAVCSGGRRFGLNY
jgi:hypothetical protein